MQYLRTNTATRITVGPFLDKTDGITPEVALTVTSEKLTFIVDTGGVPTLVLDAAPTASGGNNDMVHITGDDSGYYDLELTAANVNYLGRAKLSLNDVTTHCPVFHEFMIIPAVIYDAMILGTDLFDVSVTQILGTAVSTPATAGILDVNVKNMNNVAATSITAINANQGTTQPVNFTGTGASALAKSDMVDIAGAAVSTSTAQLGVNAVQAGGTAWGSGAITAASIAADAITDAKVASDVTIASVTGAVGSVTGNVGGNVNGSVGSLAAQAKADVNAEVDTALVDVRLDELLAADSDIDGAAPPTVGSVFHELMSKTAGSFTYDQTTDSNEALRDRGDAAWATGTAPLDAAGTRAALGLASANLDTQLTAIDDLIDTEVAAIFNRIGAPVGASISADIAAVKSQTAAIETDTGTDIPALIAALPTDADVNAQVDIALSDIRLNELMVTALASQPTAGSLFGDLTADNGSGTNQFTAIALELAPAGGGGGTTDWTATERGQIRKRLGLDGSTSTPSATPDLALASVLGSPVGASISADIAAVQSDTNDIQTRLPTALTAGGNMKADALALSGDTTAADNAESFFDGTGYAGTNNVIPTVTTLTNAPSDSSGVTTLLSRLSATRAGYLDNLSAGAVATASKVLKYIQLILRKDSAIATDNSAEVTEINANGGSGAGAYANTTDAQEALRDRGDAAWATGTAPLDAAGTRAALGLASANLDAQLTAIDDYIDAEVAAIKAKTDQLVFTGGRIDSSVGAYQTGLTPLQPTTAGRTLDVSTTGEAGLDFDNIKDASGAHTLTNITVPAVTTVANLTNAPTNGDLTATMKASINTEADTALSDYGGLKPTVAGRTLDVSATGEAGIDLANVGSPTTTLNLSGTTVKAVTDRVTANTDQIEGVDATNQIRDSILSDATRFAGANIDAAVSSRSTPAQVNAEVVDALTTDTYAEPASVPAATASLAAKIGWLMTLARNKLTQTATTQTLRNDADSGNIATSTVSDDGSTYTRNEWS